MHAAKHGLVGGHVAFDEGDVVLARDLALIAVGLEMAVFGRQVGDRHALDRLLVAAPVADQVGDGHDLHAVLRRKLDQFRGAHHRAVLAHDLAAQAALFHPREAHQVHRGLGVAGADEHAALAGLEREHMARPAEVGRGRLRRNAFHRRDGALDRGDARGRGDMVDGHGEGRVVVVGVVGDHLVEVEAVGIDLAHRHADQSLAVGGHEVDVVRRREAGGADQVAFVLARGVVDDDDDVALAQFFEGFFYC